MNRVVSFLKQPVCLVRQSLFSSTDFRWLIFSMRFCFSPRWSITLLFSIFQQYFLLFSLFNIIVARWLLSLSLTVASHLLYSHVFVWVHLSFQLAHYLSVTIFNFVLWVIDVVFEVDSLFLWAIDVFKFMFEGFVAWVAPT